MKNTSDLSLWWIHWVKLTTFCKPSILIILLMYSCESCLFLFFLKKTVTVSLQTKMHVYFQISPKSDVWSLGCILYCMTYGKTPFQHITNQITKLQAIIDPSYEIEFPDIPEKDLRDVLKVSDGITYCWAQRTRKPNVFNFIIQDESWWRITNSFFYLFNRGVWFVTLKRGFPSMNSWGIPTCRCSCNQTRSRVNE